MPGQTQTEIRSLLESAGLSPRHQFGQNFLIDLNLMRKLVTSADVRPEDVVLEVGPGTGSLTELLLATGTRVVAVEIDRGLQRLVGERFVGQPNFTLISGDALKSKHQLNPSVHEALKAAAPRAGGSYKLAANLPYQIATPLLMDLVVGDIRFERLVCTIQKEVADRLIAEVGDEAYGPISVVMSCLTRVERIAKLPASAFWPAPTVESAMVLISPKSREQTGVQNVSVLTDVVRAAFQHRRQTMRRIVGRWPNRDAALEAMRDLGLDDSARPETLSAEDWRRLANRIAAAHRPK